MHARTMTVFVVLFLLALLTSGSADIRLQYVLDEEVNVGFQVGNLKLDSGALRNYTATIADRMRFGLLSVEYQTLFEVNEETGIIYLKDKLDREALCAQTIPDCVLSMEAAIVQPTEHFTVLHIDITVRDINDNTPRFSRNDYVLTVSEASAIKSRFMLPMATDPDSGLNGVQSYHLNGANPVFSLDEGSGSSGLSLVLEDHLDRESQAEYLLDVVATDGGIPMRSGTLTVHIQIADANDNSPIFERDLYEATIPEDYDLGKSIIQVQATDLDEGQNGEILYALSPQTVEQYKDVFGINNETGVMYLKENIDYQMGTSHHLIVIAEDLGLSSLQDHTSIIINVQDVNNHRPEITVYPVTSGQDVGIKENTAPGKIVALVTAKDLDPGENGICVCESLDGNFRLEQMYVNGFKLISNEWFDREVQEKYRLTIRCQDSGSPTLSSERQVELIIYDENDNEPEFTQPTYTVNVREDASVSQSVIQVSANDPDDGDAARVTYSLDQSAQKYLKVDPVSGIVSIITELDYEETDFIECGVLALDHGTPSKTAQALLRIQIVDVNDEIPVFIQNAYNFGTYENQANNTEIGTVTAVDRDSAPYNLFVYSLYGPENVLDIFSIDPVSGRITARVSLDRERQDVYEMIVMATDIESPQPSSSVTVTIHVADKNDNEPIISVPDQPNRSVQLSVYSPLDFVFFRIMAHDRDLGRNAKLQYSLADDRGAFFIDPMQGYLMVKSNLHHVTEPVVHLDITVADGGSPRLWINTTLMVVINRTTDFAREQALLTDDNGSKFTLELTRHEQILVVLGAVTSLIVTFLVVAIVFVRRRQTTSGHGKDGLDDTTPRVSYVEQPIEKVEKVTVERSSVQGQRSESKDNELNDHKSSVDVLRHIVINRMSSMKNNHPELEVERTSRNSGELSNTDSGHGASEVSDCVETSNINKIPPKCSSSISHGTETGPNNNIHHNVLYPRQTSQRSDRYPTDIICPPDVYSKQTIRQELPLLSHLVAPENMAELNGLISKLAAQRLSSVSSTGSEWYRSDVCSRTSSRSKNSNRSRNSVRSVNSSRSRTGSELGRRTGPGQLQQPWFSNTIWTASDTSLDETNNDLSSASSGSFIINAE